MNKLKNIIDELSLKEKAALISGADYWHTASLKDKKIDPILMCDGPHGLRKPVDTEAIDDGRCETVKATCFPTASALACSWNPNLIYRAAEAIAQEAREENVSLILSPGINIKRSPLCGRNFEYFSEDPYLTAQLGIAYINGVQSQGIGACLKHLAANNRENMRMVSNSVVDERALNEIYLYAFKECIKQADPWAVMSSYNRINGKYPAENDFLLRKLLRDDWGYEGAVITDWAAINDITASIKAGLSLEMPSSGGLNPEKIVKAVERGSLDEKLLNESVERVLTLVMKAVKGRKQHYMWSTFANHYVAKKTADECIVLLKNDNEILPLKDGDNIAVIGVFAEKMPIQGGGSSQVNAESAHTVSELLRKKYPNMIYAEGYRTDGKNDEALSKEAEAAALNARKVLLFCGLNEGSESEGRDRSNINLPDNQLKLIKRVCKLNKNTAVIVTAGSPVAMPFKDDCDAIIATYLSGESVSEALCDILTGEVNPSGKLAETFPVSIEDTPTYNYFYEGNRTVYYRESVYVGYRYYSSAKKEVLFPFGHGLSYTNFTYDNLKLTKRLDTLTVSFTLTHTGTRSGKEISQLYIKDEKPVIFKPALELKRFIKTELEPGESTTLSFKLHKEDFAFYDAVEHRTRTAKGKYSVMIGASCEDIRLAHCVNLVSDEWGEDISPYHSATQLPSYYSLGDKTLSIPHLEFNALMGGSVLNEAPHKKGSYDLESTYGEIKNEPLAAKLAAVYPDIPDDMPIRAMVIYSGGILTYELADMMLSLLNEDGKVKKTAFFSALRKSMKKHKLK